MFLPLDFKTQNSKSDLSPGLYECDCLVYQSPHDELKAFIFEYALFGSDFVSACDLLIVDAQESMFFRDFMRMPDRTWRDSYGARADALPALFPPEVLGYKLIQRFALESQKVGA